MQASGFEQMLSGGHPNSLGRTEEVVDLVLADRSRLDELYGCYSSEDEVVRLRVSSSIKRVCRAEPDWLVPYLDRLLSEIGRLDQASAQWTLAEIFQMLETRMDANQRARAEEIMKRNLSTNDDWIVQNRTIETLALWAADDSALRSWLIPILRDLSRSTRKSVSKRASRSLEQLESQPAG